MRRAVGNSWFSTLYWSHALKRRDKARTHTHTQPHTLTSQPLRGARYSTVMRRAVGNSFASQSEGQQCLCLAAGQSQENCKLCVSLMCNRLVGENNLVPASQKANNACVWQGEGQCQKSRTCDFLMCGPLGGEEKLCMGKLAYGRNCVWENLRMGEFVHGRFCKWAQMRAGLVTSSGPHTCKQVMWRCALVWQCLCVLNPNDNVIYMTL